MNLTDPTLFAVLYKDGVVIAAERQSGGTAYVDNFCCVADDICLYSDGPLENITSTFNYIKVSVEGDENTVYTGPNSILHVSYALYAYLRSQNQLNTYIVSGVDSVFGNQLFIVNSTGYHICMNKYFIAGRFKEILTSYVNMAFRGDMAREDCIRFVEEGFRIAYNSAKYINSTENEVIID